MLLPKLLLKQPQPEATIKLISSSDRITYLAFTRGNQTIFSERGNLPRGVEKGDLQLGLRRLAPNSQTGEKQREIGEICFSTFNCYLEKKIFFF